MTNTSDNSYLKQNTDFLKNSFGKAVFPCMLTIISANINVFADGILVGNRIGAEALASINLSLPLFLLMCVIGSFFASGTAINASNEIGRGNFERAVELYRTCCLSLFAMSIVFTVLGIIFINPIVSFLGATESVRVYVYDYVFITLIGALPKIMIYIPLWYLRLDGRNIEVMIMMGIMSIGNVILDVLFIYFWDMGVFGAGLASVIATLVAFIIGFFCLFQKKSTFTFKISFLKDKDYWNKVAKSGIPSAFNNLASTIRIMMINYFLMSIGGGLLVAQFSAVNGIYGFGEAIVLGIPQAAATMLGIFAGEKDNDSSKLLVKMELIYGFICSGVYAFVVLVLSMPIQRMYNLQDSLFVPLLWMCMSVFFAIVTCVFQGFYNVSGRNLWANLIILSRSILCPLLGLILVKYLSVSVFSFWFIGEAGTLLIWFIVCQLRRDSEENHSKYLFLDMYFERNGQVLNFSVENDPVSMCDASEKISDFCVTNGMNMKKIMTLQLAIEELLTVISTINEQSNNHKVHYDLRAFSIDSVQGFRVRYDGIEFNPFDESNTDEDIFMGTSMIKKLVEVHDYQRTFGVNNITILLKES